VNTISAFLSFVNCEMTGITDVVKNARRIYWRSLFLLPALCNKFLPRFLANIVNSYLLRMVKEENSDPIGRISMPRLEYFREKKKTSAMTVAVQTDQDNVPKKWGILFPVCYRGESKDDCWNRITTFVNSLATTTTVQDQQNMMIFVGIDVHDELYDNDEGRNKIKNAFLHVMPEVKITFHSLKSKYRGKLCYIWNKLANEAVNKDCEFFVFVGDDIKFETMGWKMEIEHEFATIATENSLPYGFGCVCFRDLTFSVFPTFPVIHRLHLEIFQNELFPSVFINQHGDPYLFELYRRWGASKFAPVATLINGIGGAGTARYEKEGVRWCQETLTHSIEILSQFLKKSPTHACWNIVVPSFRCRMEILQPISELSMTICQASVHILIVNDNPDVSSNDEKLKKLEDWSCNHLVRVFKQEKNMGASLSRNTGMAQSFGDWCVLLDDDVHPDKDLLNAYYATSLQYPQAKILVGTTILPSPITLIEKALISSQITFFFDIARKLLNPPWGVTANLCVQGRMNNIWFNDIYPKTGGGEDVDFCLKTKNMTPYHLRETVIVSSPHALVYHPLWRNIFSQAIGWAKGDVLCLSALPYSTFYSLPNWIEWIGVIFLWMLFSLFYPLTVSLIQTDSTVMLGIKALVVMFSIFLVECIFNFLTIFPNVQKHCKDDSIIKQLMIGCLAVAPSMLQDTVRFLVKLSNGQVYQFCCHFDWMDGQKDHVVSMRLSLLIRNIVFLLIIGSLCGDMNAFGSFSFSSLLTVAIIVAIIAVWSRAQFWNEDVYRQDYLQSIPPLLPDQLKLCSTTITSATTSSNNEHNDTKSTTLLGQPFVVLAYQRTGSNYLCGRLHNHNEILMHSELFNEEKVYFYLPKKDTLHESWKEKWNIFTRNANPYHFLIDIFTIFPYLLSSTKKEIKAIGFKLFPEHWKGEERETLFRRLCIDSKIKKIILKRNSLLEVYASKIKADRTGHYIGKTFEKEVITIDPIAFRCFINNYKKVYQHYNLLCQRDESNVFKVSYEELTDPISGEKRFADLLVFLGVDSSRVPKPLKETIKQSDPNEFRSSISNYDEIMKLFEDELTLIE
jgi:glycosyltransferase involved in cell wall biosynthesis